jgi:hypothetical protein
MSIREMISVLILMISLRHISIEIAGPLPVPAHVEMMGFLGMGNNPMVGTTVAVAVAIEQAGK